MGSAVEVVHEDGRRTRMSPTWLAKAGTEQGWRPVEDAPSEEPKKAPRSARTPAAASKQDVSTTVEGEPATSEEN